MMPFDIELLGIVAVRELSKIERKGKAYSGESSKAHMYTHLNKVLAVPLSFCSHLCLGINELALLLFSYLCSF